MRLRATSIAALVLTACLLLPSPVFAWGEEGHRAIAALAYARLDAHAKAEVNRLIEADAAAPVEGWAIHSFADLSVWSDCVRGIPSFRNQSAWRYDNIPVCGAIPPRRTWCMGGDCATAAIERSIRNLSEGRGSDRERLRALARLVHVLGDIHQPLHASDNGDRGGNEVAARTSAPHAGDDPRNLHQVWDNALVRAARDGALGRAALASLTDTGAAQWARGDPRSWAMESNAIARNFIYGRWPERLVCGQPPMAPVRIDVDYVRRPAGRARATRSRRRSSSCRAQSHLAVSGPRAGAHSLRRSGPADGALQLSRQRMRGRRRRRLALDRSAHVLIQVICGAD